MIALTFDDGPNEVATAAIIDLLADRGVAATFFVFGSRAVRHPQLIARMLAEGHDVQPHCWDGHDSHHAISRAALEDDIKRTVDALGSLGCPRPTIWRPPNGDIKDPQSYAVAAAHHLQLVTWTLQTCDWNPAHSAEQILSDIDSEAREDALLRPDSVVLMHDTTKTLQLLAGLLDRIERHGYEVGLLQPDNPATARGGDYIFGRRDGKLPCGV